MSEHPPTPRLPARTGHAHTRPALDRRTILRGLGAALTLPWLEAFVPRLARADTVKPPVRLAFLFAPNGVHAPAWFVEPGLKPEDPLSPSLEPLEPVRQHVTFLRGLDQDAARAHGDGPGDHARSAAVFLTSVHPVKTAGPGIRAGISIDQVAANKLRGKTRLASLEMGLERGRTSGSCDSGYACAYSNHISWADPFTPNPKEVDPRRVFERLFGADQDDARSDTTGLRRSVLDATADDMKRLRHRLGKPGETVGEVAVSAEGRVLFGATPVEREGIEHHVVARTVEPRQREEQSVEQVGRPHESVDHAQRGPRAVTMPPMLGMDNVVAFVAASPVPHGRVH